MELALKVMLRQPDHLPNAPDVNSTMIIRSGSKSDIYYIKCFYFNLVAEIIDNKFVFDYRLLRAPTFGSGYVQTMHKVWYI